MSFGFKKRSFFIVVLFVLTFFVSIIEVNADVVSIERIAKWNSYPVPNGEGSPGGISTNGDYVVYSSSSNNLVTGDTNNKNDIFLYDNVNNTTERISVSSAGVQGNHDSVSPNISSDGRYIVFESQASNLVLGDTNVDRDIFVYDRDLDTLERVSVSSLGVEANDWSYYGSISSDGRYVTFQSDATNLVAGDTNGVTDVFVYDRTLDTIERISLGDMGAESDGVSDTSRISGDGLFVSFYSQATNLVASDTNGVADIFVRNLTLDTTERVSISTLGVESDAASAFSFISSDGRYVAFHSDATNLVTGDTNGVGDVFVYERTLGTIERVSITSLGVEASDGASGYPSLSSDGRYITFDSQATDLVAGDTNGQGDVFVYDRTSDNLERVSVNNEGEEGDNVSTNTFISPDGNYVTFFSQSSNFSEDHPLLGGDVFIYNRTADTTERALAFRTRVEGDQTMSYPSMSSDGVYVAFSSSATNLISSDTNVVDDIFVQNTTTGVIERVSVSSLGVEGDGSSYSPSISSDGRYVAFNSSAANLVAGDTNVYDDVFVYDRTLDTIERVSISTLGVEAEFGGFNPSISSDGRYVSFTSESSNLVPEDTAYTSDIFVYDRTLDTMERVSVSSLGVEADNSSQYSPMSSDGRYVAFESVATNLVDGDTNARSDIFVYDRTLDTVERVSVNTLGVQGNGNSNTPAISANGRYVAFESVATNLVDSDTNAKRDVFIQDRTLNTTTKVSVSSLGVEGNDHSYFPTVSIDGRYIAYYSVATNLVTDDSNAETDLFLYDQDTDTNERISLTYLGGQADGGTTNIPSYPSMSSDGLSIAFQSNATNLVVDDLNSVYDVFYITLDNTADAEDVVVEEEEVVETPSSSSSGSSRGVARVSLVVIVPPNTPTPCTGGALFSNLTGAPCKSTNPNTPSFPNTPSQFQFLNNLSSGIIHPDVLQLQKYLNTHGFPVTLSGAGSPGFETNKFGALTRASLIKFQLANNITPAVGFFGPITRGMVNSPN